MSFFWKNSGNEVTVELNLSPDEDEKPTQPPRKRRRGRPKTAPTTIDFEVHPCRPNPGAAQQSLPDNPSYAGSPSVEPPGSPKPDFSSGFEAEPDSDSPAAGPEEAPNGTGRSGRYQKVRIIFACSPRVLLINYAYTT